MIVPENIVAFIREISENLRDLLPTPELQDLLQKLVTYIEDVCQNTTTLDLLINNNRYLIFFILYSAENPKQKGERS